MVVGDSLSVSCRFDRSAVPQNEDTDAVLMVSLKAADPVEEQKRRGVQIVIVLDRSASMNDAKKLELCKQTITFLCNDVLTESDRLALVTFDAQAKVVYPCEPMTADNREKLLEELAKISVGTQTNLSGGLFQGLDILRGLEHSVDTVSAVLLLSDGAATTGVTDRNKLCRMAQSLVENSFGEAKPLIHAFGYGATFDPVLRDIARLAGGTFYHVSNVEEVPLAFADSLGGLLSVAAQNVLVDVQVSGGGSEFMHTTLTQYPVEKISGSYCKIKLRDVYLAEQKDILLKVRLPKMDTSSTRVECLVTVKYMDVIKEAFVSLEADAYLDRIRDAVVVQPDVEVGRQVVRVEVANTLAEARANAEKGDIQGSREAVNTALAEATAKILQMNIDEKVDKMMHDVMEDLRSTTKSLQSVKTRVEFARSGASQAMEEATFTHSQQRSLVTSKKSTRSAYTTPSQAMVIDKARKSFGLV